jgi:polyketide synthase PksN
MRPLETVRREIVVCRPIWVPEPALGHPSFTGRVLLFDDEIELAKGIEQQGNRVVRVTFSKQPKRLENEVWLGRGDQGAYDRLIADQDFDAIIHAWSVRESGFDEALERGPLSVHRLAKALISSGRVAPWLFVYRTGQPIYQAIGGYGKSLRQEHPKLLLKTVGISELEAADLVLELSDPEFEVRYNGDNRREVRKLEEWVMPAPVTESGLRSGGVYLLTGGAGGLGKIFAKYLLETFNARLVLAGRSECPRERPAAPDNNTVYVQADVSTVEGAEKAVAEAKQRFGELHGIIHAAGVLRDGLIRTKSEEDFLAVLRVKAQGAEALDQVTRNHHSISLPYFLRPLRSWVMRVRRITPTPTPTWTLSPAAGRNCVCAVNAPAIPSRSIGRSGKRAGCRRQRKRCNSRQPLRVYSRWRQMKESKFSVRSSQLVKCSVLFFVDHLAGGSVV